MRIFHVLNVGDIYVVTLFVSNIHREHRCRGSYLYLNDFEPLKAFQFKVGVYVVTWDSSWTRSRSKKYK